MIRETITPNPHWWEKLADLVQNMWCNSTLLTDLSLTILVLLPKINADTQGIGLLELLWKVVEAIIDTRNTAAVTLQDVLNGFRSCRGIGVAIMDLRMPQDLVSINQDPLLLVFLYICKLYNTLERGRLLQTLEGCGV